MLKLVMDLFKRSNWKSELVARKLLGLLGLHFAIKRYRKIMYIKIRSNSKFNAEIVGGLLSFLPYNNGFELIRIGGDNDGGYLVPDDFIEVEACFSAGSDRLMNFESDLARKYGIKSFILDTIDKIPEELTEFQSFRDSWLGSVTDGKTITLEDWLVASNQFESSNLILQMDIEGAEYSSLIVTSEKVLSKFRILVIEFHGLGDFRNYNHFVQTYLPVINKLSKNFHVVHVHPNNCCGNWSFMSTEFPHTIEVTFHRKDRARFDLSLATVPSSLDQPNVLTKPDLLIQWEKLTKSSK